MHHDGCLERGSGAFEERPEHPDDHVATLEGREDLPDPIGPLDRVVLGSLLNHAGGRIGVEVGAQRDNQDVRLVGGPRRW